MKKGSRERLPFVNSSRTAFRSRRPVKREAVPGILKFAAARTLGP